MLAKYMGIWMSYAEAHLMELKEGKISTIKILSDFTPTEKQETLQKSEKTMHHKEHQLEIAYYKKIAEVMSKYTEVFLFGPSGAKAALVNMLRQDHHFDKIQLKVKNANKMTEPQEHAFVRSHFSVERLY